MMRWILPLALVLGSTAIAGTGWIKQARAPSGWGAAPPEVQAILWPEPIAVTDFSLLDQHGARFGPEELAGEWTFMFFGYLACPDVCPMTLFAMKGFREKLVISDPRAARHRFVFVSVDPESDSLDGMAAYLDFFDPDFIGLGGSKIGVERLASSMAVMYLEVIDQRGMRSIDHTSSVMVLDPRGRVVAALPPPHDPAQMLHRFERLQAYLER